jgi:hypothetical protein
MPEMIKCARCGAPLRLPEEFFGREVRCPSCQETFTANLPAQAVAPPMPLDEPRERPSPYPDPRDDEDDEEAARRARRRRAYDEARRYGERVEPHRGGTILGMGIASLCLFCIPALALALGIAAAVMAHNDLAKMRDGRMDPAGHGKTVAGQICGIIGPILAVLVIVFACLIGPLSDMH